MSPDESEPSDSGRGPAPRRNDGAAPPPSATGPMAAIAVALAAFVIAWVIVGDAGVFHETQPDPSSGFLAAVFVAASAVSLSLGYVVARGAGWKPLGAGLIAAIASAVGFFSAAPIAQLIA